MQVTYRGLLFDIVILIKNGMINGIKKQIGADNRRFKALKPATIKAKERKGSGTPNMRMIDSGDFIENAYGHRIINDTTAEILLENATHKEGKATYAEIGAYNQDSRSMHFGVSEDTSRKIDTAISTFIDKTVDGIYGDIGNE
jgi:hypothetical protein